MFGLVFQFQMLIFKCALRYTVGLAVLCIWRGLFVPSARGILKIEEKRLERSKAKKAAKKARKASH